MITMQSYSEYKLHHPSPPTYIRMLVWTMNNDELGSKQLYTKWMEKMP